MDSMSAPQANRIVNVMLAIMVIVMVAAIAGLGITLKVNEELRQQTVNFHNDSSSNLKLIEQNQVVQTQALKDYIACLLTLQPGPTLQTQEQVCFNKAPMVKP